MLSKVQGPKRLVRWGAVGQRFAMVHEYAVVPFGPWAISAQAFDETTLKEWVELVKDVILCCTSQSVADYCNKWGPCDMPEARTCYCADYHYFSGCGMQPLPPNIKRYQPWQHKYVTVISPCAPKGLAVVLALVRDLPEVPFLAVATKWTQEQHRAALSSCKNVTVMLAREDIDEIFKLTKVLLVPSLWSEPYGLVCTEAAIRGIPVFSTDHGGLPEANVLHECIFRSELVYNNRCAKLIHNTSLEHEEERSAADDFSQTAEMDYLRAEGGDQADVLAQWILADFHAAGPEEEPVPSFKAFIQRIFNGKKGVEYLKQLSELSVQRSHGFIINRQAKFPELIHETLTAQISDG